MTNSERDKKVWDEIIKYYNKLNLDAKRNQSQHIDYYCLPELKKGKEQSNIEKIDRDEKQRLFARFLKSYLSSTWHWIQKGHGETTVGDEVNTWLKEKDVITQFENYKKDSRNPESFCDFSDCALAIVNNLDLAKYDFSEKQIDNLEVFSKTIGEKFGDGKSFVSQAEQIIYKNAPEPYTTILKMQKVIKGFGIALACDFVREAHFCNIAKPDVHICHVFSVIDGISYSMDLALVKRVSEFAANVCPEKENDFCNTGAYNVDKIIWLICSESNNTKVDFLENLNNWCQKGKSK